MCAPVRNGGTPRRRNDKAERDERGGDEPRQRERAVKQRERRLPREHGAYPHDAERAGAQQRGGGGKHGMARAAQATGGDLIETAGRFIEQDAHDAQAGVLYHGRFRRKEGAEEAAERDDGRDEHGAEQNGIEKAQAENARTSVRHPGCVVLAGEGRRGLAEGGDHIVKEIFKIHGDDASGDGVLPARCIRRQVCSHPATAPRTASL